MRWRRRPDRAVDLVEQDETNLLEQSKMTTLLGIVKKLPPQLVVSRARLQLTIAWANILLQRRCPTARRAESLRGGVTSADLAEATRADLRAEADVLRAVAEILRRPRRARGRSGRRGDVEAGHAASAGARGGRKYRGVRGDLPFRLRHRAPAA